MSNKIVTQEEISIVLEQWELVDVKPIVGVTWNYVARAISREHGKVIVKVSPVSVLSEFHALQHFYGYGAIKVINHLPNALLMHAANPGNSLLNFYQNNRSQGIEIYSRMVKLLMSAPSEQSVDFPHVKDWLKALDILDDERYSVVKLKAELLLSTAKDFCLIHGDLHLKNIVQDDDWLVIDPKGVIADIEFEVAGFDFLLAEELAQSDAKQLFILRCKILANNLALDYKRIIDWVQVRLGLAIAWCIEDGVSADRFIQKYLVLFANE